MRYWFLCLTFLVLATLQAHHGQAYVFTTTSSNVPVKWNLTAPGTPIVQNGKVVYNLNPAGSDNVAFAQVESALAASFKAWEDLPDSNIAFTRGNNRTETGTQNDGIFQVYWSENSLNIDGTDISGALAVTFISYANSGSRVGELSDVALVFNGQQYQWATNGDTNKLDIAEVATHEIGHALGLSHSPLGAATMFPRTGAGVTRGRTLARDDQIAASILYPLSDFASTRGTLRGKVRDQGGNPIFGANVVISDRDGNATASALSQPDGSYVIQGLPSGDYSAFVEPLDPETQSTVFFSSGDLSPFYDTVNTNFLTSADASLTIRAGAETAWDWRVTTGTPTFNPTLVGSSTSGFYSNLGVAVPTGTASSVGLAGPNLPTSGTPLSLSGSGITITNTRFGRLENGFSTVAIDINVAPNAPLGARNLILNNGSQRSIIAGAVELVAGAATVSVVSAANFDGRVAADSIVALFGTNLTSQTARSSAVPLPTTLSGVTVTVRDAMGVSRLSPLFFVSPSQINYQIPPGTAQGQASVQVQNGNSTVGSGTLIIEHVAPGLFSAAATGNGAAAGQVLRVRANNVQIYEPLAQCDASGKACVTLPINWSDATDRVFLVLYGTGIRFRAAMPTATLGGIAQPVTYAGPQGRLVGVDQVNVQLKRENVINRGELNFSLDVDGKQSNTLKIGK